MCDMAGDGGIGRAGLGKRGVVAFLLLVCVSRELGQKKSAEGRVVIAAFDVASVSLHIHILRHEEKMHPYTKK